MESILQGIVKRIGTILRGGQQTQLTVVKPEQPDLIPKDSVPMVEWTTIANELVLVKINSNIIDN